VTLEAITNTSDSTCVKGIVADAIQMGWNQMGTQAKGFFVALLFSWVGVHHWEYFTLSSVGGFAQFCVLMTGVLFSMNELLNIIFYPPSPDTADIYNPIIHS
jgi:hypothetical protein